MNPYIKEYAELAKDYEAKKGKRETVLALYEFSDRLKEAGDKDAKTVLVDVYKILSLMQSAYDLMSEIADRNDKKQIKKLAYLKSLAEDDGDRWAVKRPKTAAEESLQREKLRSFQNSVTIQIHWRLKALKKVRQRYVRAAARKVLSTIVQFLIVLSMSSTCVQSA